MVEPTPPIECVIFSKNRACQLDALLESIRLFSSHLFESIIIFWKGTEPDYIRAYDKLISDKWKMGLWLNEKETSFELFVKDTVTNTPYEHVCFLVDDDIFYRPCPVIINKFPFSLRLGLNTKLCQPLGVEQRTPVIATGNGFHWNWSEMGAGDFSYPFSLDGTIYRREHISTLINATGFSNPTQLEAGVDAQAYALPFRLMYCDTHSSLVNVPANRVSDNSNNPITSDWTPHLLNQKYLEGYRIDLSKMDFSHIIAAHQGVDYEFSR